MFIFFNWKTLFHCVFVEQANEKAFFPILFKNSFGIVVHLHIVFTIYIYHYFIFFVFNIGFVFKSSLWSVDNCLFIFFRIFILCFHPFWILISKKNRENELKMLFNSFQPTFMSLYKLKSRTNIEIYDLAALFFHVILQFLFRSILYLLNVQCAFIV